MTEYENPIIQLAQGGGGHQDNIQLQMQNHQ